MAVSLAYIVGPLAGGKLAEPSVVSWFTDATPERADVVGPDRAQPRRQRHAVWGGLREWPWRSPRARG
jgi:hypothetical protein